MDLDQCRLRYRSSKVSRALNPMHRMVRSRYFAFSALGLVVMLGNCGGLISTWSYVATGKIEIANLPRCNAD
jgi:hypothetical protein